MPKRKLPANEIIVAEYLSGLCTTEIAEKWGVKPGTVVSLLNRIGVKMRNRKEAATLRENNNRRPRIAYWKGKKQPDEMVESRISKIRGENHYLWKGGLDVREYRKVIEKIKCAECDKIDDLVIHHIDYDHFNNDIDNLIVLCNSCHISFHKKEYWKSIRNGEIPKKSNKDSGWGKNDI